MCRTALGKGENENAFSLIRQRQKVHSIHTTLVCVCIAMTPLSRMKTMLKECLPAWIRLLIPLLCSWSRVMGGEKKATGPRRTVNLDWRIKTRSGLCYGVDTLGQFQAISESLLFVRSSIGGVLANLAR